VVRATLLLHGAVTPAGTGASTWICQGVHPDSASTAMRTAHGRPQNQLPGIHGSSLSLVASLGLPEKLQPRELI